MTFMIFIRRPGWAKTALKIGDGTSDTSNESRLPTCSTVSVLCYQQRTGVTQKAGPYDWKSCSEMDHGTCAVYPPRQGTLLKTLCSAAPPQTPSVDPRDLSRSGPDCLQDFRALSHEAAACVFIFTPNFLRQQPSVPGNVCTS